MMRSRPAVDTNRSRGSALSAPRVVLVAVWVAIAGFVMAGEALQAQPSPSPDPEAAEVLAVLDRLFEGMRARDGSMLEEVFHPDAQMVVAPSGGETPVPVAVRTVEGFIEQIGSPGEPLHEPYFDPEVRIDGHLAQVWTFYHLFVGEAFSHCGYDSFQLLHTPEGWKIVFVAYTVRETDCGEPSLD